MQPNLAVQFDAGSVDQYTAMETPPSRVVFFFGFQPDLKIKFDSPVG